MSEENKSATAETNTTDMTQDEIVAAVDELAQRPARQRVWEVDFLRGFMILFVVWDHFMYDVSVMFPYKTGFFQWLLNLSDLYYHGALRADTHDAFVSMFVFTSGVSCSFSRNNGKRAIRMISFALLFTAITATAASILHQRIAIYFNVIHVIALSVLLWTAIEWCWEKCQKDWQKNIFGVVMTVVTVAVLVVGYSALVSPWKNTNSAWFFLAEHNYSAVPEFVKFCGADYLPFFPDFGWFLVGAFLGRMLYKERKSLFPSVNSRYVAPITFCGRYSIWVYFGSQVVMYGFFYLFGEVLKWL